MAGSNEKLVRRVPVNPKPKPTRPTLVNLERLIFIKPKEALDFNLKTNSEDYSPGD